MDEVPFTCPVCKERFTSKEGYQRKKHLEGHSLKLLWACTRCAYKTGARRFHDHSKHWKTRHFGLPEPPTPEVVPEVPVAAGDTRRVTRSSRSPPAGSRSSRGRHSPRSRQRESPVGRGSLPGSYKRATSAQEPETSRRRRPARSATVSRPPSSPSQESPGRTEQPQTATASASLPPAAPRLPPLRLPPLRQPSLPPCQRQLQVAGLSLPSQCPGRRPPLLTTMCAWFLSPLGQSLQSATLHL